MKNNEIFKKAQQMDAELVQKHSFTMVSIAKNIVIQAGINRLLADGTADKLRAEYNKVTGSQTPIIDADFYSNAVELAVEMAKLTKKKDGMKLLMCLLVPTGATEPVDGDICPVCGETLEFMGDQEIVDDGTIVSWTCPGCGATGRQGNDLKFEKHYCVKDADGNAVDPADFAY